VKVIRVNSPKNLEICDVPEPEKVDSEEILVKVKAAGICGSDLHIYHGTSPVATYPRVIGHEFVGEIVKVGSKVEDLNVGDHVVVDPVVSCGECYPCSIGRNNVCASVKVRGVHVDGGFAEYVVLPKTSVYKISDELSWEEAALIEPFTIAAQVADRGGITEKDSVLIMGAGPIGLVILQVVKKIGAKCMVADLIDKRLELAKEIGADMVINSSKQDVSEIVFAETNGLGVTVAVEAVGLPELFEKVIKITAPAGRIVVLGFVDKPSQIPELEITKKELDVRGSRLHTNKFPQVVKWFNNRELNPKPLISHVFHFTEIKEAINLIENNSTDTCKVVLRFE
jgi:L-gulonate 5-dehydrogenase